MLDVALLGVALVLVVSGAESFLKGVLALARRWGVSPFLLTVVISGFEVENLAAGLAANAKGLGSVAAGTFLGGTTFVALAVAGASGVLAPMRVALPPRVLAWTAAAPLPLLALGLDGRLTRLDGVVLLGWFAVAVVAVARAGPPPDVPDMAESSPSVTGLRRLVPVARVVGGLSMLSIGGELLGDGVRRVVARFGVSPSLLGNTVVAAAVEAEEIARVAVPSKRGRADLALANVIGTIVHFTAFNAAVIALVRPMALDDATVRLHLPATAAATAVVCGVLWRRRGLGRREGVALLTLYAAYLGLAVIVAVTG